MNSSLRSHIFLKGHKHPVDCPSNFNKFCEGVLRKFKGSLPENWDLVFLSEKSDKNGQVISSQEEYDLMLKLSQEEGSKGIEIRKSNQSDCTSSKFSNKENLCQSFEIFDSEKAEKDVAKPKDKKIEKERASLKERDCNIPFERELEFSLKNIKEEDSRQREFQREEIFKPYGFDNMEHLQAEAMKIPLGEEEGMSFTDKNSNIIGLEELLAASKDQEIINHQIEFQKRYAFLKEAYDKGLQESGLRNLDDVKEDLEHAKKEKKRFEEAGRLGAVEKEHLKIEKLTALIEFHEEMERLELEEEQRQDEQRKQEKLSFFKAGLEEFELRGLKDVEDELEAVSKEVKRLENRPGKALQDAQTKKQKLESLLPIGEEIEKFLVEEEFKHHQNRIKEKEAAFKEDLESSQLTCIEDVRGDLKAASDEAKRLENRPGREKAFQDCQKKVKTLEGLIEKWEEIERLKTEEKERQRKLGRDEQEIDPPKYLEDPALSKENIEPSVREEIPHFDKPSLLEADSNMKPNVDAATADQEKQNIKSELINLTEEANSMPNCFERFLIFLYCLVLRKVYSEYTESEPLEFVDAEIPKALNSLYKRAKDEMLDTKSMKQTLNEISFKIKNIDWESAKKSLRLLLKQIQPLSIAETERLINKGSEAANLVRGKDAILFFGETGAGKSTTLLYLSGAKLIKKLLEQGYHYLAVDIKNPVLAGVTTSASSASETRYIRCIQVPFMDIGISKKGCAYFLDLPGYDDSAGAEVDISNAVNIFRTIAECKSVKPLVLVSRKSLGERMKGIKTLARILAGMLPDIKEKAESSPFTYLFTKFSEEEIKFVEGSIKDVLKKLNPEEDADDGFCNILEDILYKIEDGIQAIDPLASDQAKKILKNILDSSFITQPDQRFKFSIAEGSKATLQKQCNIIQGTIRSATERMDFELVFYKLSQLKKLSELVNLEFLEKYYSDSIQFVSKFFQAHYQNSVEKFTRCLKEGNTLEDKDLLEFIENLKHAQAADLLRNEFLSKEVPSSSAFSQNITIQTNKLKTRIQQSSINEMSLENSLEKLQLLSQHFVEVQPEFENSVKHLKNLLNESIESFKSLHSKDEFDKGVEILDNIFSFMERMGVYLNEDIVKEKKEAIQEFLITNIEGTVSGLDIVFRKSTFDSEDAENVNKRLARLRSMKEKYKTQLDNITSVFQGLIQRILNSIKERKGKMIKVYKEEEYDALSDVKRLFQEIDLLRKIPEVAAESHDIYDEAFTLLRGINLQVKNDLVEGIKRIDDDPDYANLLRLLLALHSLSWMDDFNQDTFAKTKRTIEREVMKHSETHKKQLEKLELDLDNCIQLEKGSQIASKLNEILVFQEFLPVLSQNKEIIRTYFEEKVEATLNVIQNYLDSWNTSKGKSLDKKRIERSILYLQKCNALSLFKQKSPVLLQGLETFIEDSSRRDSEQLEKRYQEIMSYDGSQNNGELGNSIRTSIIFNQIQEDPSSNENSDNISSVSEQIEINFQTNKERLVQNAQIMSKLLKQTLQFQRDFPNLYQIYDAGEESIVDYWTGKLRSDLKDLSGQMLKLSTSVNRSQELQKKLYIARALSLLDEFIEGEKFSNIYEKYQTAHYTQTAKKFSEYIESVKNGDYNPIAKNIKHLRNCNLEEMACSEQYEELKNCLSESLENLMMDTISTAQQVFIDKGLPQASKITLITANRKKLAKAKECFEPQDLSFSLDKFQECDEKVRKIISQGLMSIVKEYEISIAFQSFLEAERQRQRLEQFCYMLGENWEHQKKEELDQIRLKGVEKIVKPFEERSIFDYIFHSPRKVYSRLELGRDDNFYKNQLEKFKDLIEGKCWSEMKRIESLDITKRSDSLKKIQSLLTYLPQPVEENLSKK